MGSFLRNIHPLLNRNRNERNYDGANYAILNAVSEVLGEVEKEAMDSKMQSSLETATGEWLDTWGDWFGLPRKPKEGDEHYRARIIRYVLLKRGTIPAIKEAIKEFFDDPDANVEIYEPWRNIFYTNKSRLNGPDHLMGEYYRFAVIDITLDRPMDPKLAEVIEKFKPAGVKWLVNVKPTSSRRGGEVSHPLADSEVSTESALDKLTGIGYTLKCQVNPGEQFEDMEESNIFITNKSHLNGPDVLAGSHTHGRGEVHYIGVADSSYEPPKNANLFELKKEVSEVEQPYQPLLAVDGVYLTHTASDGEVLVIAYNLKESLSSKYRKEYHKVTGETPENVDPELYAEFFGDVTHNLVVKGLVAPGSNHKVSAEVFNYVTNRWQTLTTDVLTAETKAVNGPIGHLTNFIGDEGFLVTRLVSDTGVRLDIDLVQLSSRVRFSDGEELMIDQSVTSYTKQEKEWVAYADSPDGVANFSTVIPNENMWVLSKVKEGYYVEATGAHKEWEHTDLCDEPFSVKEGDTVSLQYWNVNDKALYDPVSRVSYYNKDGAMIFLTDKLNINQKGYTAYQVVVPKGAVTAKVHVPRAEGSVIKVEVGSYTPYYPSPKDDPKNSKPKYRGVVLADVGKQPTNPSDYTWVVNN